ncbi:MAG: hypothetical protein IPJ04_13000 [Candidatus Eisenbacteria bacterium]|nr:hypothetical protein [Candidatus Eisenbacteria bacterium]
MRFLILLVALLCVASPAAAEWSSSPVTNLTVCSAANSQFQDYVISDGVGGAYVAWVDPRSGGIYHLYAQHYDGRGNALWAANGLSIGSLTTFQGELVACGDGVGGLILAWRDDRNAGVTGTDIYVQRLNSSGAALWTANGLAVCTAANTQQFPKIVSDGAGGVFVAWSDWRDSATWNDVCAQHVLSGGTMAWTANGRRVQRDRDAAARLAGPGWLRWCRRVVDRLAQLRDDGHRPLRAAHHEHRRSAVDPQWPRDLQCRR